MKIDIEEVQYYVKEIEQERSHYRRLAREWEDMWALDLFEKTPQQAIEQDGQEQVTLATPMNTVNLAERLISTDAEIECPANEQTEEANKSAVRRQQWLKAMWQRANKQARRDLIGAAWWQSLVRGRGVFEIKWVLDVLPKKMQARRMPIHIRTLEPMNCGFRHGELFTEIAFHKYRQHRRTAAQRYPGIKKNLYEGRRSMRRPSDDDEIEIIDYWYASWKDGSIWNCILCDGYYAKKPTKTDYIDIPLVEFLGDDQPASYRSLEALSILHGIKDTWPYMCRLASQIATGNLWDFWPHTAIQNEYGAELPSGNIMPGETQPYPWGTKIEQITLSPNWQMANQLMGMMQQEMNESTFPPVLRGESQTNQAGYAVSILGETARGKTKKQRRNLETAIEHVNEIALGLVEEMGDGEVSIWGESERLGGVYTIAISAEDIGGYYENAVRITTRNLTDEIQKATLGIRLADSGYISAETLRQKFVPEILPVDEQTRIEVQQAMSNPQIAPVLQRKTLQKYFGPNWQERLGLDENEILQNGQMNGANGGTAPVVPPTMPMIPPEMGQMPPQMGAGGPQLDVMPPPGSIQPDAVLGGMASPQLEGQITEDMFPLLPPQAYQALLDEGFTEQEILEQQNRGMGGA